MVVLGRLIGPYGVSGWMKLHPFGDDPQSWAKMPVWWVAQEGEPWREMPLKAMRAHSNGLVVLLDGVSDRSGAEALKGTYIAAPREQLPVTASDEYYWGDLVGLKVINAQEEILGEVAGLIETGANDVLRVLDEDGIERLLPFVGTVVRKVDKRGGVIRVEWGSDW